MFTHALMTWGDKMTKAEIDDIFGEFEIDEDYDQVQGCHWSLRCCQGRGEEGRSTPSSRRSCPRRGRRGRGEEEEEEGRQVNGYFSISMKPQRPLSFPVQAGRLDGFLLESWAVPDADFSATFVTFLNSSI